MEVTTDQKLRALYNLQTIDFKLDKLNALRGELPIEVSDLEDEIVGLETRLSNITVEVNEAEDNIVKNKARIKESQQFIKKYEAQLANVKNNREYDALNKEIELQGLEILAAEKRISEFQRAIAIKNELIEQANAEINNRKQDLEFKKNELTTITEETKKEEDDILVDRAKAEEVIDERLLAAYKRIRGSVKNGIAVATIVRDSCGGCFAQIPPQRQADIRTRKKVMVCEHCGRILVDAAFAEPQEKPVF